MSKKSYLLSAIMLVLAVVLFNPQWLPLSEETVKAVKELTAQTFFFNANTEKGIAKLAVVALLICVVGLIATVLKALLKSFGKSGKRQETISELCLSILKYASVIVIAVGALSILGVNMTAIIASLGIVGLILGFGAQSLIQDVITGIFIIFEGQFDIGDIIILDDCRGVVKRIGVRTTTIEDAGGNLKIVNNSDIRNVQNRSVNPSVATIIVAVSYDTDIRLVEKVLADNLPALMEVYPKLFVEAPKLFGVDELADSGVNLKVGAKVKEEDIFTATRVLNREVKIIFDENNIEIPFPQVVVHNSK